MEKRKVWIFFGKSWEEKNNDKHISSLIDDDQIMEMLSAKAVTLVGKMQRGEDLPESILDL